MLIALAISLLLFSDPTPAPPPRGPVAVVNSAPKDLGVVADAAPAFASFEIGNDGDQPLHLTLFARTRGIKGNPRESLDVPPKGRTTIQLEVDTRDVFGPAEVGVQYATNDPANPRVALKVKIVVKAFVLVRPGFARYDYVQEERPGLVGQTLWSADGQPFAVTGVDSPAAWLAVSFRPAREEEREKEIPGKQWRVEVTIMPNAPVGPISSTVTIHVNHPLQKEVRIPIGGFVRPVFAMTPPFADLGKVRIGQALKQNAIEIQNFATEKIDLTAVKVSVEGLKVAIENVEPGHRYRLRVSIAEHAPAGPFAGAIVVTTSSQKEQYIEIPIRGEFVE
jgi:hypothetical protein